ncbi:hypothetical protein Fcan01_11565 [Folsomia candida]|uniref:Uncharacterized protein n=1 Tax=Folsomia candida TaxID=158441 RepID=A0A226E9X7_FOLCA|nr:hypothetical protein Fcan01_11565 [Folsomia candida]
MFSPKSPSFHADFPELPHIKKLLCPVAVQNKAFHHHGTERQGLKKHMLECHEEKPTEEVRIRTEFQVPNKISQAILACETHTPMPARSVVERAWTATPAKNPTKTLPKLNNFRTDAPFISFTPSQTTHSWATKTLPPAFGGESRSTPAKSFCRSTKSTTFDDWMESLNSSSYETMEMTDRRKDKTLQKIHRSFGGLPFPFQIYGGCRPSYGPGDHPEGQATRRSGSESTPPPLNDQNSPPTAEELQNSGQDPPSDLQQPPPAAAEEQHPSNQDNVASAEEECRVFLQTRPISTNPLENAHGKYIFDYYYPSQLKIVKLKQY